MWFNVALRFGPLIQSARPTHTISASKRDRTGRRRVLRIEPQPCRNMLTKGDKEQKRAHTKEHDSENTIRHPRRRVGLPPRRPARSPRRPANRLPKRSNVARMLPLTPPLLRSLGICHDRFCLRCISTFISSEQTDLHSRVHRGAYWAQPSRRVYISKEYLAARSQAAAHLAVEDLPRWDRPSLARIPSR